jgi:hypothetical protein
MSDKYIIKNEHLLMDVARYKIGWMFISVCNSGMGRMILRNSLEMVRSANYEAMLLLFDENERTLSGYIYIFDSAEQYEWFMKETDYVEWEI